MKWIYESVLKSRLTYAASVWLNRTNLDTSKRLLDSLRGIILKTLNGVSTSTPNAVLGMVMTVVPFQLTIREAAIKALLMINNSNQKKTRFESVQLFLHQGWHRQCPQTDHVVTFSLPIRNDWTSGRIIISSHEEH